jgi:hypothetical protein
MVSFLCSIWLTFLLSSSISIAKIQDCGKDTSILQLTDLALKPDPPIPGQLTDMTVKFVNPGVDITDGTVTTSITLNFIPFSPTVEPLCTNTKCPLVSGLNDRSTSNTFPDSIQGKLVSKIVWTTLDGSQLLCIQINTVLGLNATKLRGSIQQYNATVANQITKAFQNKKALLRTKKNITSTSLIPYEKRKKHQHKVKYFMNPLPIIYNKSMDVCFPYEKPIVSSRFALNYPLVVWTLKPNALR